MLSLQDAPILGKPTIFATDNMGYVTSSLLFKISIGTQVLQIGYFRTTVGKIIEF